MFSFSTKAGGNTSVCINKDDDDDDDDVPPSKFEDEHDLRLNLRLSLRALGFCLLDPIVLI